MVAAAAAAAAALLPLAEGSGVPAAGVVARLEAPPNVKGVSEGKGEKIELIWILK